MATTRRTTARIPRFRPGLPCTPVRLPAHLEEGAARLAVQHNPANRGLAERLAEAAGLVPRPSFLTALTSKWWGAKGVDLSVSFMEATTDALKNKILAHMNAWSARCNVRFRLTNGTGQVRFSRGGGGYWSYLGTDVLSIAPSQQTMNLEGFTLNTPDSEYARVVRHETGHCLDGDTLIDCPRDLEKFPLGVPIKDLVGRQPWVYAWAGGRVVVRKASRVWLSKRAVPTVRVKLRTEAGPKHRKYLPPLELVGTADHPVLLSDGVTWKNLGDLGPGDRLCSMYRQSNGERSTVTWTGRPKRIREHVLVCQEVYGPRPDGHDAHHRNERKLDQSPENLEWKPESAHHRDHSTGRRDSPETTARRIAASRGRTHTDESRAKMSLAHQALPPMSEATRAKLSAAAKGKKQSPGLAAKRAEGMRRFYEGGGRSGMLGKTASDETRAKRSASMKATLARKRQAVVNHVVVSAEPAGVRDVYDMTVPDADCFVANGVVVHNSLGFPHEHMRAELVDLIDPAKAIAYFGRTQGWDANTVRQQVLTPLEESSLLRADGVSNPADQSSIMCYSLPGSITKNGKPILGGTDIDAEDWEYAAKLYPPPAAPPVPPPVSPPVTPPVVTPAGVVTVDPAARTVSVPAGWTLTPQK